MANKRLNAVITIGGTVTGALKNALGMTRTKLQAIGSAVRDLEKEQRRLQSSMRDGMNMGKPIGDLHKRYQDVTAQIAKARAEQEKMNRAVRGMDAGKSKMASGGLVMGAAAAAAATALVPIVQAASFEKAMLGVAKQVDGARDGSGKLTAVYYDMAKQIQLLGREIPVPTNELAKMAEAGARMGVAKGDLIEFVRTTAMMGTALDLPREELADNMGKIANLFKLPIPEIKNLGDAINYLDDNSVSKGGDIIDFLTRTGGVAGAVHVTGREMAALGSTLLSLGERSETASTASNAFIQKLAAAEKGPKKFQAAMEELGLSSERVQKGMQKDAQATILSVLDAVNRLPKDKQLGVLVDLVGLEHSDTIAKLSNGLEEYRKQIEMVNSQKVAGSMSKEFAAQLATTSAQWEITKNRVFEVGVNIGSVLLPAINEFMGVIGKATSGLADFVREHPRLTKNIAIVGGAILGGLFAWGALTFAVGAVQTAFWGLAAAITMNPIGLIIGLIAAGAALIIANWDVIGPWFASLWDGIKGAAETAWNWFRDYLLPFTPLGPIVQNWQPISDFFGVLWGAIKSAASAAWNWISENFLNYSPLGLVIKNWGPLKEWFSALWGDIKNAASVAVDWILGKLKAVGEAWQSTKRFFGLKAEGEFSAATMWKIERAPPPPPPAMATRGGYQDNSKNTFHITQQPGQDGKGVAEEVGRMLGERGRKGGSELFDKPRGY